MKETVLITGAHGLVARHLQPKLESTYNVKLLSTHPDGPSMYHWDIEAGYIDADALKNVDYIIHLAGAKFYDGKPLTEERKAISWNSRVGASHLLLEKLKGNGQTLKSFISSSAAGYYDFSSGIMLIDENGPKGDNDNANLCEQWEAAADEFQKLQVAERVVSFRNSAVLAMDGGLLQQFIMLFKNNPGLLEQQRNDTYLPWIHIDDMANLLTTTIMQDCYEGVYNNAADEPVSMDGFVDCVTDVLKKTNHYLTRSPYIGTRISSGRLKKTGFIFEFNNLEGALKNLLG